MKTDEKIDTRQVTLADLMEEIQQCHYHLQRAEKIGALLAEKEEQESQQLIVSSEAVPLFIKFFKYLMQYGMIRTQGKLTIESMAGSLGQKFRLCRLNREDIYLSCATIVSYLKKELSYRNCRKISKKLMDKFKDNFKI